MKVQENGEKSFYYQSGAIRLGSSGDTNHEITYNASVDGPKIKGNQGGFLSTTSRDIVRWNNSGVQIHNDDLEVGTSSIRKTIRYNGVQFATRAFFTRFVSAYNYEGENSQNNIALLDTHNPQLSNDYWRVFCFEEKRTDSGGRPEIPQEMHMVTTSEGIIPEFVDHEDNTNFVTYAQIRGRHNCLKVSSDGFYRLDFDIALKGKSSNADHRLRWIIMKNKYSPNNKTPISVGSVDIDGEITMNFHLCGATRMVVDDRLFVYYQTWDPPPNDVEFNGAASDQSIYWSYASITMHSI
jgi:hypothetical protein